MKYTLLELVQNVLSSMDSDSVNTIYDSVEAQQVATVVRTVYFDIIDRANLPEHYTVVNLTSSVDNAKPVLMTVPSTVSKIEWVKYDKQTVDDTRIDMQLIPFITLEEFLRRMHMLDEDESTTGSFVHTSGTNSFTVLYMNNGAPSYYTSFDDNTLLFNSYDADVDTVLQGAKTLCYGKMIIPFTMEDSFTPDLDDGQFSLLLNEAKALAWAELKQTIHQKAEVNSKRGWNRLMKNKFATEKRSDFAALPHFGRK